MGLFQVQRLLYRYETCFSHRIPLFKAVTFLVLPGGPSDSKIFDEIVTELIRL